MDRRRFLAGTGTLAAAAALGPPVVWAAGDVIRSENAKSGTTEWMLSNPRVQENKIRCPWIEGYCNRNSVKAGEKLEIRVSTNPPAKFTVDIYRLGYYGGKGGRLVERLAGKQGSPQPEPSVGDVRVRECNWETVHELTVPADWPSGVYLGKLTEQNEKIDSYVVFIVRDDRPCDFLFQCSDTTWAAYNRWPDVFSLYDDGTPPHNWYTGPGVSVGFDRPYGRYRQIFDAPLSQGSGEFLLWEFPLAFWMEQRGYDVSYISNIDTHADSARLLKAKSFISVGHDEYWSVAMYDHAKAAIDAGVHAAFFCGNSVDGVLDIRGGKDGAVNRVIERVGKFGGPNSERERSFKTPWKWHGPDPAALMGAQTTSPANGSADWTCTNDKHWLFDNSGMKNGDSIKELVGWEHHGPPLGQMPGLEVLARGPVSSRGRPQNTEYTAITFPGPKGNTVFNAATIWWSDGLSAPPGYLRPSAHGGTPPGPDARVQRITENLFRHFLA